MTTKSSIDSPKLAALGEERCRWFRERMPVQRALKASFSRRRPLAGCSIAICMHIEPKTAVWIDTLQAGGAKEICLVGCVGSTQPPIAAYLAGREGVSVLGKEHDTHRDQTRNIDIALATGRDILLDNGGSMIARWHGRQFGWSPRGATEETRSGQLEIESKVRAPRFPVIVVDDSPLKKALENTIGVGQSVVDGLMRATSLLLGGKRILIIGYGWCGRGIASRLRGMGAVILVHDVDPVRLLQAKLEGNTVEPLTAMLRSADIVLTATGRAGAIGRSHIPSLKDGAILCNAGHFAMEIDTDFLRQSFRSRNLTPKITEYRKGKKHLFLLAKAHLVNLAAADGNPIEIMDMGLGLQALCAAEITSPKCGLPAGLHAVPRNINVSLARLCLSLH